MSISISNNLYTQSYNPSTKKSKEEASNYTMSDMEEQTPLDISDAHAKGKKRAEDFRIINNARLRGKDEENPPSLKKAIKDYQNNVFSCGKGKLTDKEKEDIKMLTDYIMEGMNFTERYRNNELTQEDFDYLNECIESLFVGPRYSKADFYEFVIGYLEPQLEDAIDADNPPDLKFKVVIPDVYYEMIGNAKPMSMLSMAISPHQLLLNNESR